MKLSAILLFFLGLTGLQAQESINTSGSNVLGKEGSVSYSIGQIVYTTDPGTSGSVAQGVQQPFEISVATGLDEAKDINLSVSVYPNPTTDYLTLSIGEFDISKFLYQLFDMSGKLLRIGKLSGNKTQINMSAYVSSTYFVHVITGNQSIKTFKIIKN